MALVSLKQTGIGSANLAGVTRYDVPAATDALTPFNSSDVETHTEAGSILSIYLGDPYYTTVADTAVIGEVVHLTNVTNSAGPYPFEIDRVIQQAGSGLYVNYVSYLGSGSDPFTSNSDFYGPSELLQIDKYTSAYASPGLDGRSVIDGRSNTGQYLGLNDTAFGIDPVSTHTRYYSVKAGPTNPGTWDGNTRTPDNFVTDTYLDTDATIFHNGNGSYVSLFTDYDQFVPGDTLFLSNLTEASGPHPYAVVSLDAGSTRLYLSYLGAGLDPAQNDSNFNGSNISIQIGKYIDAADGSSAWSEPGNFSSANWGVSKLDSSLLTTGEQALDYTAIVPVATADFNKYVTGTYIDDSGTAIIATTTREEADMGILSTTLFAETTVGDTILVTNVTDGSIAEPVLVTIKSGSNFIGFISLNGTDLNYAAFTGSSLTVKVEKYGVGRTVTDTYTDATYTGAALDISGISYTSFAGADFKINGAVARDNLSVGDYVVVTNVDGGSDPYPCRVVGKDTQYTYMATADGVDPMPDLSFRGVYPDAIKMEVYDVGTTVTGTYIEDSGTANIWTDAAIGDSTRVNGLQSDFAIGDTILLTNVTDGVGPYPYEVRGLYQASFLLLTNLSVGFDPMTDAPGFKAATITTKVEKYVDNGPLVPCTRILRTRSSYRW